MAVATTIWSLGEAMGWLRDRPGPGASFVTRAVVFNQSGALLELLEMKVGKLEWTVLELERVRALVRVDNLFSAAINGYLPHLATRGYSHAHLDLLRDWSRDVDNAAVIVGPRFASDIKPIGRKTRKYVVKLRRGLAAHALNREIADMIKTHKASNVLLRPIPMDAEVAVDVPGAAAP